MGWSGGTDIFDNVANSLLHVSEAYDVDLPERHIHFILNNLSSVLEDYDWDTEHESQYFHHPTIGQILGNTEISWEDV